MGDTKDLSFAELREKLAGDLLIIFLAIGFPLGIASTPRTFGDGDTSWHVAVGRWIWQHGRIPASDPFSFTAFGKPWVAMEWPADLLFAGAFNLFGYAGLAALTAGAIMALNAILLVYLRSRVGKAVRLTESARKVVRGEAPARVKEEPKEELAATA